MCGICGITGRASPGHIEGMLAPLAHRGPDGEGIYHDPRGRVSMGARRLSVIDVEGGAQPLSNETGTVWAALNGEIYNFRELRSALQSRGHVFRTGTDTEVLVHLYEDYGSAFVHALDGMFAIALWDETRGSLILARDRFGEKPLFLCRDEGNLAFASELTSLTAGQTRRELNADAVDSYFVLGYVPGPASILNGAEQLPPGHILEWDGTQRRSPSRPFWRPLRFFTGSSSDPIRELEAETLRLLEESVSRTLVADVPVGIFLSGGIDSSLITAIATKLRGSVSTFTVGYDVGNVSEIDSARHAAHVLGTDHRELVLTQAGVASAVPELFRALDQPLADPALVPLHAVARFARDFVTVAVGGEGADELFGGYPRYRWLARSAAVRRVVPSSARAAGSAALHRFSVDRRVLQVAGLLDSELTLERHVDWVTADRRHARAHLYGEQLRGWVSPDAVIPKLADLLPDGTGAIGAHGFMDLDQRSWLPDDVLAKADRAGMLCSLELRTPYLGRELAEFANSISSNVHLARSGKHLLRRVLARLEPRLNTRGRKTAFRVPGEDWLRGSLAELMREQIEDGRLIADGWFDRRSVRELHAEHLRGANHASELWPILALGLWYDGYVSR